MRQHNAMPKFWVMAKLGDVLQRSTARIEPSQTPNTEYFYIGLENIASHTGELVSVTEAIGSEIQSAKYVFQTGDILYGRLRPYLNKVHLAQRDGICSTDIWVLKPRESIHVEYALYYLRSTAVLQRVTQSATGANLPRVDSTAFDLIPIPLPPLPEQERIVEILRRADEVRQLRRRANQQTQQLTQAIFHHYFGLCDPRFDYPDGWSMVRLSELFEDTQYGTSEKMSEELQDGVAVLRMNNITVEGYLDLSDVKFIPDSEADLTKYDLRPGDILFNRTNSIDLVGKTAIWEEQSDETEYTFASYLIRVRLKEEEVVPEYIWALLNSVYGKSKMFQLAKRAVSMANINTGELGSIPVVLPPRELQLKFLDAYKSVKRQLGHQFQTEKRYESLLNALKSQAFTGQLTAVWRSARIHELTKAAAERDSLLGIRRSEPRRLILDLSDETGRTEFENALQNNVEIIAKSVANYPTLMSRLRAGAATLDRNHFVEQQRDSLIQLTESIARSQIDEFAQQVATIKDHYKSLIDSSVLRSVAALNEPMRQAIADLSSPFVRSALESVTQTMQMATTAIPPETWELLKAFAEQAALLEQGPAEDDPRYPLLSALSEDQYEIYLTAIQTDGYFTPKLLAESAELDPVLTTNTLDLLVETGLLHRAQVDTYPDGKTYLSVTVYRQFGGEWDLMQENDIRELNQLLETADS
jgi:type I restriction enzyme, S subunit